MRARDTCTASRATLLLPCRQPLIVVLSVSAWCLPRHSFPVQTKTQRRQPLASSECQPLPQSRLHAQKKEKPATQHEQVLIFCRPHSVMITQAFAGPAATLVILPRTVSMLVCGLSGILAGPTLGIGVMAGRIGAADIATLVIAAFFACAALTLLLAANLLIRLEDNFDCLPWQRDQKENTSCPFTGALKFQVECNPV